MFDIYSEVISLAVDKENGDFKEDEFLSFEIIKDLYYEYGIFPIDFNSYRLSKDDYYRYTIMGKLKKDISL